MFKRLMPAFLFAFISLTDIACSQEIASDTSTLPVESFLAQPNTMLPQISNAAVIGTSLFVTGVLANKVFKKHNIQFPYSGYLPTAMTLIGGKIFMDAPYVSQIWKLYGPSLPSYTSILVSSIVSTVIAGAALFGGLYYMFGSK